MKNLRMSLIVCFIIGSVGMGYSFNANAGCHSCDFQEDDKRCEREGMTKKCEGEPNWLFTANCAEDPGPNCDSIME